MCYIQVIPVHILWKSSTRNRTNAVQITPAHERDTVVIRTAFLGRPTPAKTHCVKQPMEHVWKTKLHLTADPQRSLGDNL
jgi:hypothetical protein